MMAETIIGISTNSTKYPPNPKATVAAVIIDVMAVSQPIRKAKKLFLKAFLIKIYSAAAFGNIDDSSA